ncbi:hypothetical protein ABZP36_013891 [Zizania latifolia]
MAKVVFFAALLAALVAVSVAQTQLGESEQMMRFRDRQCLQEVQESSLDACRQVLDRQLTGRERFHPMLRQGAMGQRLQCCQQLQDVSRECRCSAIRRMVRDYEQSMPSMEEGWSSEEQGQGHHAAEHGEQQQQRMIRVRLIRAKQYAAQLPAMCRIEPQQCSIFAAGQN